MAESFLTLMADWDDRAQAEFTRVSRALRDAGFTGTQTADVPYHISLATFSLDDEERALALTRRLADTFAPLEVHANRVGTFPGGKVLFAVPERNTALSALQEATGVRIVGGYPWSPHTTLLIDDKAVIDRAFAVAEEAFRPVCGRITHLHLCAFWPMREILRVPITGAK